MIARVRARTGCRIDLAGGTLDIWPLGLIGPDGALTVNVAIDCAVTVEIRPRARGYQVRSGDRTTDLVDLGAMVAHPDTALLGLVAQHLSLPAAEISIDSRSPRGAGLGASSAIVVALTAAIDASLGRASASTREQVAVARDLEARLMGRPTGVQDQYPPLLGGALAIHYRPGGETVEPLEVDLEALGQHLVVAYSGQSHVSADSNWHVIRSALDGDPTILGRLNGIADTARALREALLAGELARVGAHLDAEWRDRRALHAGVSTPPIERLLTAARDAGAWGGKVCGAGGGGCIAVLAPPERRAAVAEAVAATGGQVLDVRPTPAGVEVESIGAEDASTRPDRAPIA